MKMPNRNQIMILIGLVVTQGPAIKSVADWLGGLGIPRLSSAVSFLGWLATALGSAALAWPGIRTWLSTFGLATPPGEVAPLPVKRDAVTLTDIPETKGPTT